MTAQSTASALPTTSETALSPLDVAALRQDFPALHQTVHGKPLVYLDNAASAQTPHSVIDTIRKFYLEDRSNIHRGVHELSQRATNEYENARVEIQRFLGAADTSDTV